MLQSIQYVGSGPPTYVYSKKAAGASNEFYHVFATETRGYRGKKEERHTGTNLVKKVFNNETQEQEEFVITNNTQPETLQDAYQKEYGRRESFLWKQR